MRSKLIMGLLLLVLIALPLCAAACEEEVTPPSEEEEEQPPAEQEEEEEANWWDDLGEPQYGDTITIRSNMNFTEWDGFLGRSQSNMENLWLSPLLMHNWTTNRDEYSFNGYVPYELFQGCLAQSWEITNYDTVTMHIREGIHWQDKEPVNGREFTAYDVEYHFHRAFGLGSGFTEPQALYSGSEWQYLESVTATGPYTVVFKFSQQSFYIFDAMTDYIPWSRVVAREVIEQYGDTTDWHNAVGTGAWILEDWVDGSQATLVKNPDYFRFDERYPENRLPYADELRVLVIPDDSAAIAALRTGQVDIVEKVSWSTAAQLAETNPEFKQYTRPLGHTTLYMNLDNAPFNNVLVRKALQMAVNIPEIAEGYYGGMDDTIYGKIGGVLVDLGYTKPFEEWPEETKEAYTYDVEGAKDLLEQAGYGGGFDTNVLMAASLDTDLVEIIKSYFEDINVNLEIRVEEDAVATSMMSEGLADQMYIPKGFVAAGRSTAPDKQVDDFASTFFLNWSMRDPVYDEMAQNFHKCLDLEERKALFWEIDNYLTSRFTWIVISPVINEYCLCQPYLNGWSGEGFPYLTWVGYYPEVFWIDQDLKTSMGR